MIVVDGLQVCGFNSLGGAWEHIRWMYEVATQKFTVGDSEMPVVVWLSRMARAGYMDHKHYMLDDEESLYTVDTVGGRI